ncbi:hypothetical protein F4780DRAFT_782937 [Xylariomycetidae sp. FL0641]|nr:hypothetical protein F4780DRAFT_782937 [Xylariomycetidae sp. FL0641]
MSSSILTLYHFACGHREPDQHPHQILQACFDVGLLPKDQLPDGVIVLPGLECRSCRKKQNAIHRDQPRAALKGHLRAAFTARVRILSPEKLAEVVQLLWELYGDREYEEFSFGDKADMSYLLTPLVDALHLDDMASFFKVAAKYFQFNYVMEMTEATASILKYDKAHGVPQWVTDAIAGILSEIPAVPPNLDDRNVPDGPEDPKFKYMMTLRRNIVDWVVNIGPSDMEPVHKRIYQNEPCCPERELNSTMREKLRVGLVKSFKTTLRLEHTAVHALGQIALFGDQVTEATEQRFWVEHLRESVKLFHASRQQMCVRAMEELLFWYES